MKKREKNIIYRRLVQSYLSSVISISMVLLLSGLSGLLAVNARSVSDYFRENIKMSILFEDDVSERRATTVLQILEKREYVKEARFISREEGKQEMIEMLGEDFISVFDTNPIPLSIDLFIKARYMETDSLPAIEAELGSISGVREVVYHQSLVKVINDNMEKAGYFLAVFILLLFFISFVLINNTVRLNLYSKRFTIHTMKLVGAKRSFIRKPLLAKAFLQGVISGSIAVILLSAIMYLLFRDMPEIFSILNIKMIFAVLAGVVVLGVLLCVISTFFIVNRLVTMSGDDMFY